MRRQRADPEGLRPGCHHEPDHCDPASGVQLAFQQISGALLIKPGGTAGKLAIGQVSLTRRDGVTPLPGWASARPNLALSSTTRAGVSPPPSAVTLDYTSAAQFNFLSIRARWI